MRKEKKMKIREYLENEHWLNDSMVLEFTDKVFGDLSEMTKDITDAYLVQIREEVAGIQSKIHFNLVSNPFIVKSDYMIDMYNNFVYKARKLIKEADLEYDLNAVEITAYYDDGTY